MYDPLDQRGVPQSRGVPMIVRIAAAIGIIAIFIIGAAVILDSGYGHMWPAERVLRVPLTAFTGK